MAPLRVLSLFAGIGGIDLGLERAGMQILAHSEIEPYACKVLAKHWPDVPNLGSVVDADFAAWAGRVDVIAGGFPCQDISYAGLGAGIQEGTRSGLWYEYARSIRDIRPLYVIVENVAALLARGLDVVLGDMAALGYDAWWDCVPAAAVGAPHRRDRVFVVATRSDVAPFDTNTPSMQWAQVERSEPHRDPARSGADADSGRLQVGAERIGSTDRRPIRDGEHGNDTRRFRGSDERRKAAPDPHGQPRRQGDSDTAGRCERDGPQQGPRSGSGRGWWRAEPGVGRVAPGISNRVDRLRCLGNAVVPQVAQYIGELVVAHHEAEVIQHVA